MSIKIETANDLKFFSKNIASVYVTTQPNGNPKLRLYVRAMKGDFLRQLEALDPKTKVEAELRDTTEGDGKDLYFGNGALASQAAAS
jgi:hypothetical protein